MNYIPIKKLYNPQYDLLSTSDRMELLNKIGKIYNLLNCRMKLNT